MATIPDSHKDLLTGAVYANLATIMADGRPQLHPVWSDYDGSYVRVNTAVGRQKDINLQRRHYATILLIDPDDHYRWMEIRGHVAERIVGEEAEAHIDSLSLAYRGVEPYQGRTEGMRRVMYKIEPDRVLVRG
jgi:PPOX class probable F420-dependent enzyme